jgi:hypothetical protein
MSGAPIGVFLLTGDRRATAIVRIVAVENETARIVRNGAEEAVELDVIGDPQAIRRRANGDSWFSRLLDKISWL